MIVVATRGAGTHRRAAGPSIQSDRNCYRMTDRWERAHGLSPRVNDAARDRTATD